MFTFCSLRVHCATEYFHEMRVKSQVLAVRQELYSVDLHRVSSVQRVGVYLSFRDGCLWDREAGGSNPLAPTLFNK